MSRIFLSHTSSDKPFVRKLATDLRAYGHTVWIDEAEINIGDSLIGKIREGLDSVDYIAVVLSKASIESEWVKKELEIASNREIKEKKKLVLPIKLENVELPGFLEGKFYGDFSDPNGYDEKLQLLLRGLGNSKKMIPEKDDELEALRQQLKNAKEVLKRHEKEIKKVTEYTLSTKSKAIQDRVKDENESYPKFAPINNVYAFEVDGMPITIGYLLHVLRKARMKGGHQFEWMLSAYDKWNEANRMIEAYADMVNSDA